MTLPPQWTPPRWTERVKDAILRYNALLTAALDGDGISCGCRESVGGRIQEMRRLLIRCWTLLGCCEIDAAEAEKVRCEIWAVLGPGDAPRGPKRGS